MNKKFRYLALSCTTALAMVPALACAQPASTDEANAPDTTKATANVSDIVVTGTRIRQDGYNAPTPVNVLGAADLNAQKPANIADVLYTVPAVSAVGLNSRNGSGYLSAGIAGINTLNLRGLGSERTLVLLNGQRIAPSTFGGLVDVNTIPQDLVERVEIVTGGASALYGSDAIGGVVNFILDEKFKGLKLGADTSVTTYGDARNYRFTGTAGLSLLDDRLHVLLNGEYSHQDGVGSIRRPWNNRGYQLINNPAYTPTNGQPERLVGPGIGYATVTRDGLINSGQLQGTYFLGDGTTRQLNYGVANDVSSPWMVGGDWRTTMEGGAGTLSLVPTEDRISAFGRIAFDVTPDITVYGQFSWNRYHGPTNFGADYLSLTVAADNAYLLTQYPQVAAAMQANQENSLSVDRWSPFVIGSNNSREVFRYVAGAKGDFSLFDRSWSWDVYYQRGVTKTHEELVNIANRARFALAQDAVISNGQVVCRSTLTDPTNGCVPIDLLGTSRPSAASLAYIFGPEQPWRKQRFTQDVAAVSFTGELFDLPGGPVAIALGGEWRKDQANGRVGATSSSGWRYGNYRVNRGKINVKEAFVEASLPVFAGLDINAAGRYTDYSTSGSVGTWKVGATYSPIRDVKFRAAYSHDIRAPSMQNLFLDSTFGFIATTFPSNSPTPGSYFIQRFTSGNPDLKPESANTLTAGIVLTPTFLPGFSASFDYYDIKLKEGIDQVSAQDTVNFCYAGFTRFCDNIVFSGGLPSAILNRPVNFGKQRTKGLDIEASYTTPLSAISSSLPGDFRIHAAVTHPIKSVIDNLVFPVDYAGVIGDLDSASPAAMPSWIYRVSAFYEIEPATLNLVVRGFSSGVYGTDWIECTSNCPPSTLQNRTINNNRIKGAIYFDGSVSVKIPTNGNETQLSFIVKNILNRDPSPVGLDPSGTFYAFPETIRSLYDELGRTFRVSLTTKF